MTRTTEVIYVVKSHSQTGHTDVIKCSSEADATSVWNAHEGKHKYLVSDLEGFLKLPEAVLLRIFNQQRSDRDQKKKLNQTHLKELWKSMSTTAVNNDVLKEAAEKKKAEIAAKAAEAKKEQDANKEKREAEAKAKNEELAKKKADREKLAADKKAEIEKKAEDRKAQADIKKLEIEAKKAEREAAKAAAKPVTSSKSNIARNETITLLVDKNPKKETSVSYGRFALYENGMTVDAFIKAGGTMGDINWDLGHRFISLSPAPAVDTSLPAGTADAPPAAPDTVEQS